MSVAFERLNGRVNQTLIEKLSAVRSEEFQFENTHGLLWENQRAIQRFYQLISLFDAEPNAIDINPEGFAVWESVPSLTGEGFYDITLRDVFFVHHFPKDHIDFMSISIQYKLKGWLESKLSLVSDIVHYDRVSETLSANCAFPNGGISSIAVIKMLNEEMISEGDVEKYMLYYYKKTLKEWMKWEETMEDPRVAMPITYSLSQYLFDREG